MVWWQVLDRLLLIQARRAGDLAPALRRNLWVLVRAPPRINGIRSSSTNQA